ncbi:1,4-alpha-glucan branching enzyme GlgB [Pseudomonas syringae pv. syringae]|nr:1,4-alpha-glucan branching enzyme GlgB [Pseudomonas syringae pv. syringae]
MTVPTACAYLRWSNEGEPLLVVANMTPVPRLDYRLGAPMRGAWTELLNSDAETYAGSNFGNGGEVMTEAEPAHGMEDSLVLNLPPLAVLILKPKKD